eukprot:g2742.t1
MSVERSVGDGARDKVTNDTNAERIVFPKTNQCQDSSRNVIDDALITNAPNAMTVAMKSEPDSLSSISFEDQGSLSSRIEPVLSANVSTDENSCFFSNEKTTTCNSEGSEEMKNDNPSESKSYAHKDITKVNHCNTPSDKTLKSKPGAVSAPKDGGKEKEGPTATHATSDSIENSSSSIKTNIVTVPTSDTIAQYDTVVEVNNGADHHSENGDVKVSTANSSPRGDSHTSDTGLPPVPTQPPVTQDQPVIQDKPLKQEKPLTKDQRVTKDQTVTQDKPVTQDQLASQDQQSKQRPARLNLPKTLTPKGPSKSTSINLLLKSRPPSTLNWKDGAWRSCKYRGVSRASYSKWLARITMYRSCEKIGLFQSPIYAAIAYDTAAVLVHGNEALLNFPLGVHRFQKRKELIDNKTEVETFALLPERRVGACVLSLLNSTTKEMGYERSSIADNQPHLHFNSTGSGNTNTNHGVKEESGGGEIMHVDNIEELCKGKGQMKKSDLYPLLCEGWDQSPKGLEDHMDHHKNVMENKHHEETDSANRGLSYTRKLYKHPHYEGVLIGIVQRREKRQGDATLNVNGNQNEHVTSHIFFLSYVEIPRKKTLQSSTWEDLLYLFRKILPDTSLAEMLKKNFKNTEQGRYLDSLVRNGVSKKVTNNKSYSFAKGKGKDKEAYQETKNGEGNHSRKRRKKPSARTRYPSAKASQRNASGSPSTHSGSSFSNGIHPKLSLSQIDLADEEEAFCLLIGCHRSPMEAALARDIVIAELSMVEKQTTDKDFLEILNASAPHHCTAEHLSFSSLISRLDNFDNAFDKEKTVEVRNSEGVDVVTTNFMGKFDARITKFMTHCLSVISSLSNTSYEDEPMAREEDSSSSSSKVVSSKEKCTEDSKPTDINSKDNAMEGMNNSKATNNFKPTNPSSERIPVPAYYYCNSKNRHLKLRSATLGSVYAFCETLLYYRGCLANVQIDARIANALAPLLKISMEPLSPVKLCSSAAASVTTAKRAARLLHDTTSNGARIQKAQNRSRKRNRSQSGDDGIGPMTRPPPPFGDGQHQFNESGNTTIGTQEYFN